MYKKILQLVAQYIQYFGAIVALQLQIRTIVFDNKNQLTKI